MSYSSSLTKLKTHGLDFCIAELINVIMDRSITATKCAIKIIGV